ncbi:MAG TPA: TRAP transporter small permease subunit [Gammaproteobacteria bacterium]|nr:TRAP transporter small permease subunit [Xanthomonadales bacterium]MCB1594931.1 TRAP transporter small permease subunit [Xanthomonadales bacterium]HPI95778.1 TRAP transporter small permease subunit [Gammaproteobacteria bacterium]HPQ87652.1 TRAP transporter small permease subunit [Gammaproteobacteria bacterium]
MRKLGETLSVLVFVMLISSFVLVSIRYLFNIVPIKFQELVVYLHSIIFMLGIVYAYARNSHVRIDIFYQNMNKEKQRKIDLFGTIFLLIPFFGFILFSSYDYVWSSISKLESSPDAGGLPFVYALKTLLIIMPVLMILTSLSKLWRRD